LEILYYLQTENWDCLGYQGKEIVSNI